MKKAVKPLSRERMRLKQTHVITPILKPHHIVKILATLSMQTTADKEQISKKINIACSHYHFSKEQFLQNKHKRDILRLYQTLERALGDARKSLDVLTFMDAAFLQRAIFLSAGNPTDAPFDNDDRLDNFKKDIALYYEATHKAVDLVKRFAGSKKPKPILEAILVYHLAEIYEKATGRTFNRGRKNGGALQFVTAVFKAVDPDVGAGTIDAAMRKVMSDR
ncbi:MAG: hypothetical protein WBK91_03795 [Alphaproteobacteria bacterium]